MSTKITLDNPTGAEQWIPDLGVMVENGESIQIDSPLMARQLLQNPIWKGRRPSDETIARYLNGDHEEPSVEGGSEAEPAEVPENEAASDGEGA